MHCFLFGTPMHTVAINVCVPALCETLNFYFLQGIYLRVNLLAQSVSSSLALKEIIKLFSKIVVTFTFPLANMSVPIDEHPSQHLVLVFISYSIHSRRCIVVSHSFALSFLMTNYFTICSCTYQPFKYQPLWSVCSHHLHIFVSFSFYCVVRVLYTFQT